MFFLTWHDAGLPADCARGVCVCVCVCVCARVSVCACGCVYVCCVYTHTHSLTLSLSLSNTPSCNHSSTNSLRRAVSRSSWAHTHALSNTPFFFLLSSTRSLRRAVSRSSWARAKRCETSRASNSRRGVTLLNAARPLSNSRFFSFFSFLSKKREFLYVHTRIYMH